ncbi:hypothetical protein [Dialister sp.]|nr:hypothetical protein [Dialister sp.]MEE3453429.1 hypothetical protein [Dialister sp.]
MEGRKGTVEIKRPIPACGFSGMRKSGCPQKHFRCELITEY